MTNAPDLSHFFAIHRKMRIDTRQYARAVETATVEDRRGRLEPLARWAKGFAFELDEHHYVEDHFFFPELRERIPSVGLVLDDLDADHRVVEDLLGRWTAVATRLADPRAPFGPAKEEAVEVAIGMRDLLQGHLDVEDHDVLPLYWRHYSAADYDAVYQQAVKNGKKKGLSFVVPWNVSCLEPEAQQVLVGMAPLPLKVFWLATKGRFVRLESAAFDTVDVDLSDIEPVPAR
jgi:hemerythrin-like domain-containing protein